MKSLFLLATLLLSTTNSFAVDDQGPAADCDKEYDKAKSFGCCYNESWGWGYEQWVPASQPIQRSVDLAMLCYSKKASPNRFCTLDGSPIYGTKAQELPSTDCKARGVVPFKRWGIKNENNPDYSIINSRDKRD